MRFGSAVHAMFLVFVLVACVTKPVVVDPPKPTQPALPPTALPETPAPDASPSSAPAETKPPERVAKAASPPLYEASSANYRRDAARHGVCQRVFTKASCRPC